MPELQETTDSSSVIAAAITDDPSESSAAQAAEDSAESRGEVAASDDDFSRLRSEYKQNILSPEDESAQEAQPEQVEETVEATQEAEIDPLAEVGPRTLEALKQQFPRTPTTVLQELERVDKQSWEVQEKLNSLGGQVGVEIAGEVMPLLLKANPVGTDADKLLENLFLINPPLGVEASKILLDKAFEEDEIDPDTNLPIRIATANAMIKKHLNPKYDLTSIEELIKFDEAGLIDKEELRKDLEMDGESETVKALKAEVASLKQVKDKEEAERARLAQVEGQKHYQKATTHVSTKVMDALIPLAEHYGWTATKEELNSDKPEVKELAESKVAMGELLTAWMNNRMRQLPEWAAVDHLAKSQQAFNEDGNPTHLFTINSEPLKNKILAEFKEKVRVLNRTFGKSFGSTRAAQKAKTIQRRPNLETPAVKRTTVPNANDDIETVREKYRQEMRQIATQAG